MPKVMKEKAISILEGGIEAYLLGLCGLSLPINWNRKKVNAKYAPVIGLFGTAVELIVKACLVQAKGIEVMYKNEDISAGMYKNATEIIAEFKADLIKNNRCIDYVWENKKDIQEQQRKLIYYLDKFHLLQDLRAKGLHAGIGCSRDVAVVISNEIYDFINILAKGKKLKAYLKHIPAPEATVRDREAIIEDLSRRLHVEVDNNDKIGYLRNMYMVLPYIPEIEPEWMRVFKRIEVVPPTKDDVNYLIKTLEDAHSIYLLKARGGKEGIPVKVESKNPNALPIAIQNMKRVLSNIPDEFNNDALTANTRFEKGILDLPIKDFLIDLYALGLEEAGIVKQNEKLTAQQIWSFIVSAYSVNGTPYPCWEFVRRCDELDKLIAILEKTKSMGTAYWKKRADTVIKCVIAIKEEKAVCLDKEKDKVFRSILGHKKNLMHINKNPFTPDFIKNNPISDEISNILQGYLIGEKSVSETLQEVMELKKFENYDKKVAIALMRMCVNYEDRNGQLAVFQNKNQTMNNYLSEIRKAMFYTDFLHFGPELESI